jgi:stage V sporulation protein R
VMLFLLEHAPLKPWQLEVLSILRDEAYYFAPQAQTKIMNEGWASYWHSTIMTTQGLDTSEIIHYCDHHSGTLASSPSRLNPYKLGIELFRDIEDRWNKGRFGKEYDDCEDMAARRTWNKETKLGRQKIFEVRRIHNDLTFIDTFLTLDFCRQHKLFSFGYNPASDAYEIESREFPKIKQQLLFNLTNVGRPRIQVREGNYKNRGELFLEHQHNGVDLKLTYARDTLANLHRLWSRPVHIETVVDGARMVLSYDGSEHKSEKLGEKKS